MPSLTGPTFIEIQDAYASADSNNYMKLGQRGVTADGRTYRWAKVGASALVAGNVLQSPANDTAFNDMAVQAAAAVGANTIAVTLGGTAVTASMFDGGTISISAGSGMIGQIYTIASHTVQTSTTGTCTFTIEETVAVALTTSATATVRKNPYMGVIQAPTTLTGTIVGVANVAHAANKYAWVQTGGPAAVLMADTSAVGRAVMAGTTVGAAVTQTAGYRIIGQMMAVAVSGETSPVHLTID